MSFNFSSQSSGTTVSSGSTYAEIFRALESTYFFLLMTLTPPGLILATINNLLVLITIAASPMLRTKTSQTALVYYIALAALDIVQIYFGHFFDLIGKNSFNIHNIHLIEKADA